MKYILELEDEPNKEYFGEGNYYRCKQIPYWSISESMRNRLEPYDEADRKTEPTGSKMEQVEDEPLTCSFSDCDNFKNPDYARCIECKRKQIELKTEPNSSEIPTGSTTEDCSVVEERSSE